MKKLYNKALLYQSFYSSKWIILITSIVFALICYILVESEFDSVKYEISMLYGNTVNLSLGILFLFAAIFLGIVYISMKGFKKSNVLSFITTGPFNRSEILINEIYCLFATLLIYIGIFIYILICYYYRNIELISFVDNFMSECIFNVVRLLLVGMAYILYLKLMDTLISSTNLTVISMILLPVISLIILSLYVSELSYFISFNSNVFDDIYVFISKIVYYVLDVESQYTYSDYFATIIFMCIVILVMSIILYIINKRFSINNINKFFSFSIVEKFVIWLVVFTILTIVSDIVYTGVMFRYTYDNLITISDSLGVCIILGIFIILSIVSLYLSKLIRKKLHSFM